MFIQLIVHSAHDAQALEHAWPKTLAENQQVSIPTLQAGRSSSQETGLKKTNGVSPATDERPTIEYAQE